MPTCTEVLRAGARQLLMQATEMQAADFLEVMKERKLADGRDRFVRHGRGPQRSIQTGIGPVEVSRVKTRDAGDGERHGYIPLFCAVGPALQEHGCAFAGALFVWGSLRLLLGRRHLSAGTGGRSQAMHPCHHWYYTGGTQGTGEVRAGVREKHAKLASD